MEYDIPGVAHGQKMLLNVAQGQDNVLGVAHG